MNYSIRDIFAFLVLFLLAYISTSGKEGVIMPLLGYLQFSGLLVGIALTWVILDLDKWKKKKQAADPPIG